MHVTNVMFHYKLFQLLDTYKLYRSLAEISSSVEKNLINILSHGILLGRQM